MSYVVTAPLVIVRDETGAMHHLYRGAPVPDTADKDHLEQLVDGEMIEKVKAAKSADGDSGKSDRVEDVLAEVGEDKEKAAVALEQEKAGKNRKTLVEPLEALLAKSD